MSSLADIAERITEVARELTDSLEYDKKGGEGFYIGTYPNYDPDSYSRDLIYADLSEEDAVDIQAITEDLCYTALALARLERTLKERFAEDRQLDYRGRVSWLDLEPKG